MRSAARSPSASSKSSKRTRPQVDFEALDRVRCVDTCGLAQLQLGQLYTIKHVLPGGLLVFTEFTRIRAFHPAGFTLVDPHCRHDRGVKAARPHPLHRTLQVPTDRFLPAASMQCAPAAGPRHKARKALANHE